MRKSSVRTSIFVRRVTEVYSMRLNLSTLLPLAGRGARAYPDYALGFGCQGRPFPMNSTQQTSRLTGHTDKWESINRTSDFYLAPSHGATLSCLLPAFDLSRAFYKLRVWIPVWVYYVFYRRQESSSTPANTTAYPSREYTGKSTL
ncbi:hypothetical protein FIBSPDRAFT_896314 [Athelia psychrophila]|uniref:Uncharacterized protein n=1 Tax=Athelia psychrophila TaxID=1759441 RepID=A0A166DKH7_9AGAM|nr:hypothetical protein FIBSPDRAFT_896314 [Fibularhizoctonia sp. CBS 109695]